MSAPRIDIPLPGFYKTRLVKNGPWVAGRIWLDTNIPERPDVMVGEIDGIEMPAIEAWGRLIGNPITKAEFDFLTADKKWAQEHAAASPAANPRQPISLAAMPAISPRR
jgi:hypothetical protein